VEMASDGNRRDRDWYLGHYFGAQQVYRKRDKALKYAFELLSAEMYVEYGIVHVDIGEAFPKTAATSTAPDQGEALALTTQKSGKKRKRSRLRQQVYGLRRRNEWLNREVNRLKRRNDELKKQLALR
jgi:hypothetical protein